MGINMKYGTGKDAQRIADLKAEIDTAIHLLDVANCPQCGDKSGAYYDDHGQIYQCQWCYEVNELKAKHKGKLDEKI